MCPILFSIGNFSVASYGVLAALGYAVYVAYMRVYRDELGFAAAEFWDFILISVVGALTGAKLGAFLLYHAGSWGGMETMVRQGFSFYQGFWTALLCAYLYCRFAGKDFLRALDRAAVAVPLAHAVGRMGCLLAGCCYGKPTSLPWGIVFTNRSSGVPAAMLGTALHPTQVYETAGNLLLALALHLGLRRKGWARNLPAGALGWAYVFGYAVLRFSLDPLRGDAPGRINWVLSTAQWAALASAAAAALIFLVKPGRRA